jgi:hypothetical protein
MRYRVRAIRVETAEKVVRATDEEDAIRKNQEDLAKPYSFFGRWETKTLELEVVSSESRVGAVLDGVPAEGPPLL